MARLLRVDRPGLWYHLTACGNERRTTFRDDRDREHFLELLGQWVERFCFRLHAYVLMAWWRSSKRPGAIPPGRVFSSRLSGAACDGNANLDIPKGTLNSIYSSKLVGSEHMKYAVVIEKSETGFGAYVPDLPGCVAVGETVPETERMIREAIEFHIEGRRGDGLSIPEPSTVAQYVEVGTQSLHRMLTPLALRQHR